MSKNTYDPDADDRMIEKVRNFLALAARQVLADGIVKHVSYFTATEVRSPVPFVPGKVLRVTIEFVDVDEIEKE